MRLFIALAGLLLGSAITLASDDRQTDQETPIQFFETVCTKGWRTGVYEERNSLWHYKRTVKRCPITV